MKKWFLQQNKSNLNNLNKVKSFDSMESVMQPTPSFLKCSLCNLSFNLKNKEPINLKCCDEIACRECVETLMMKSEDKKFVIKGEFDCLFCNSDHCAQIRYNEPV